MTQRYKHVYCTCCVRGNDLIDALYLHKNPEVMPDMCKECYPFDPEDSRGNDLRVNYRVSLSGWWWLAKWDISDYFRFKKWKRR